MIINALDIYAFFLFRRFVTLPEEDAGMGCKNEQESEAGKADK